MGDRTNRDHGAENDPGRRRGDDGGGRGWMLRLALSSPATAGNGAGTGGDNRASFEMWAGDGAGGGGSVVLRGTWKNRASSPTPSPPVQSRRDTDGGGIRCRSIGTGRTAAPTDGPTEPAAGTERSSLLDHLRRTTDPIDATAAPHAPPSGWSYSHPSSPLWSVRSHVLLAVTYTPAREALPAHTRRLGLCSRIVDVCPPLVREGGGRVRVRGKGRRRLCRRDVYAVEDVVRVEEVEGGVAVRGWDGRGVAVRVWLKWREGEGWDRWEGRNGGTTGSSVREGRTAGTICRPLRGRRSAAPAKGVAPAATPKAGPHRAGDRSSPSSYPPPHRPPTPPRRTPRRLSSGRSSCRPIPPWRSRL